MDSQLFHAIRCLISAFLGDFGYLTNQTRLLVQDAYIQMIDNEQASTIYSMHLLGSGFTSWTLEVI